jgi:hypothetical protein
MLLPVLVFDTPLLAAGRFISSKHSNYIVSPLLANRHSQRGKEKFVYFELRSTVRQTMVEKIYGASNT